MRIRRFTPAFTLVEVLVVTIIISLLVSIVITVNVKVQKQSRDNERDTDVSLVSNALEKYYRANGGYPSYSLLASTQTGESIKTLLGLASIEPLVAPALGGTSVTNSYVSTNNCSTSGTQVGFDKKLNYSYCTGGTCNGNFCSLYKIMYYREIDPSTMITITGQYNS